MNLKFENHKQCLQNKTILVTGAGDGIGKAVALDAARYGAEVILLGKTTAKLEAVYDEIIALSDNVVQPAIIPMDLAGATQQNFRDMAASIEDTFTALDGVVHCAGQLGSIMPFEQFPKEMIEKVMLVNATAPFVLMQSLLPVLKKSANGSVIFTSSSVGRKGRAFWGPYAVSKFATEGMMQVLADEYDNTSMRFNCINPGATATKMRRNAYPAEDPTSLKRPSDISPVYIYLLSEQSQDINGQSIDAQ